MKKLLKGPRSPHLLIRFDLKMKLSAILIFVAFSMTQANDMYSQRTKISLNIENATLGQLIDEIESKTEFRFIYKLDDVNENRVVSVKANKEMVTSILDRIFYNTNTTYKVVDRQIYLSLKTIPGPIGDSSKKIEVETLQGVTVSGTITDDSGQPLAGANVIEKGTSHGVQTDFDGKFSFTATDQNSILVISYIGFLTKEVTVGQQTTINISLTEDAAKLEEVVVVGYGSVKREEITSAIVKIDAEDFNGGNVNSPAQLLQGKVAGLNIAKVGGNPNQPYAVRLRGLSTFGANTEPLVVIDGVIGGSIESVDPNDIASINVLKDASAGAIYGTRGSTGVIIITTKSGSGAIKPSLEYRGYVAMESISNSIPMANREQFLQYGGQDFGSNTDWLDLVSRDALSKVHNIAFSGSSQSGLSYRAALNYRDVEGVLDGAGFKQVNARINVTQSLLDDKLKLTGIIATTDRDSNLSFDQAFHYALTFNPTAPIYENRSAEQLGRNPNLYGGYLETGVQDVFNPVALISQNSRKEQTKTLLANFKAELEVIKDLKVAASYSNEATSNTGGEFFANNALFSGANSNGSATRSSRNNTSDLFETTATYNGLFKVLSYNLLAGYSFQKFDYQGFSANNTDFITNEVGFDNLGLGLGINNQQASVSSNHEESKLSAYFGRMNLNYNGAAYFSASYRREASSRFGANNRWGNFWAVSGGVDIVKFVDIPVVNQLKIRTGYGVTGNEPAQRYAFLERLGVRGSLGYVNGKYVSPIAPVSNPNPDLKWEEKGELDFGLDFALFEGRLSGSFDYYIRDTKDLLNTVPVPSPPNLFGQSIVNLGQLETKGYEGQINFRAFKTSDFKWDLGANFSTFKSTLIKLNNQENAVQFRGNLGAPGLNNTYVVRVAEGEEIGNIRAGIFAGYNDAGQTLIINQETGEPTTERNLDRDGVIVGNGLPDFTFGLNNSFQYKNFDLNFFFRAVVGHSLVNISRAYWEHPKLSGRQNIVITDNFNPNDTELDAYHSGYVEKADFVKLDNATLGYTIQLPTQSFIKDLRLYISGNNLITITGYSGSDPEVRYSDPGPITEGNTGLAYGGDILVPGIDRRTTSLPTRTITFGINVKL